MYDLFFCFGHVKDASILLQPARRRMYQATHSELEVSSEYREQVLRVRSVKRIVLIHVFTKMNSKIVKFLVSMISNHLTL